MAIQDEIDRLAGNVADTYSALSDLGAELPEEQNSDNLADTARTVKVGSDPVQSDWSINDTTDPAYVKNRTHYTTASGTAVALDEKYIPTSIARAANVVTRENPSVSASATGSYYVRNIKFSTEAETPTVEGDICFKLA